MGKKDVKKKLTDKPKTAKILNFLLSPSNLDLDSMLSEK